MNIEVQAVIFDIDDVITDGKKYTDGTSQEIKAVAYKDLDAINVKKTKASLWNAYQERIQHFQRKFLRIQTIVRLTLRQRERRF